VNAKVAKKFVDQKFCAQLIDLFDSEVHILMDIRDSTNT
jgi:hypothetical protein